MSDAERLLAAYLFLCALEKTGVEVQNINVHLAWIDHCQNNNTYAQNDLLSAAQYAGFRL